MKGNFGSSIIVRLMKAVKVFKIKKKKTKNESLDSLLKPKKSFILKGCVTTWKLYRINFTVSPNEVLNQINTAA